MPIRTVFRTIVLSVFVLNMSVARAASCLDPFLVHSDQKTEIGPETRISGGGVSSNHFVEFEPKSQLKGDLVSGGNAELEFSAKIDGNVKVHGTLTRQRRTTVTGTISQNIFVPECAIPQKQNLQAGHKDIVVNQGHSLTLVPGKYGIIKIKPFGKLTLKSGVYVFKSFEMENKSRLIANLTNAPLQVDVIYNLLFGEHTVIDFLGIYNPSWVQFYSNQTNDLIVGEKAKFRGILTAPHAQIVGRNEADIQGAFYGRGVKLGHNCKFGSATADSDNDGVPDIVERITGTDPNNPNSKPQWAIPSTVLRDKANNEVVEYNYGEITGYSLRTQVRMGIEANLLANNLSPVVWVAKPSDYGSTLPSLPAGFGIVGSVFNIATQVNPTGASVNELTMGLALPDNRPDWLSSRFVKVYHFTGSAWVETPIKEITHDAIYFASTQFSPFFIAMSAPSQTGCTSDPGNPVAHPVIFVDSGSTAASPDGCSWATAYSSLYQVMDGSATNGEAVSPQEIWVSKGTYYPSLDPQSETDRTKTFQMITGVNLFGGFSQRGVKLTFFQTSPTPGFYIFSARVPSVYETILSGEIGAAPSNNNSFTVIKGANNAILDGFVIEKGVADDNSNPTSSGENRNGAGMDNISASPTVRNCTFRNNITPFGAGGRGGAIFNYLSDPHFENCRFYENEADMGGVAYTIDAGAVYTRCRFFNNRGNFDGSVLFTKNVFNLASGSTFLASVFTDNIAAATRGTLSVSEGKVTNTFYNCTMTINSGTRGQAILYAESPGTNEIYNSIIWEHVPHLLSIFGSKVVNNSIISDLSSLGLNPLTDLGNSDADPLFANTVPCGSVDCPFYLLPGSPAIDAANSDFSIGLDVNRNRAFDYTTSTNTGTGTPDYVDIGAFEDQYDTDGDGIPDEKEINGVAGAISNVSSDPLYANPMKKDVFIEVDWMQDATHNQKPPATAISDVVSSFSNSPVPNPDGTTGINLHVDLSNSISWSEVTPITQTDWSNFDALKDPPASPTNFPVVRRPIYHYCIFLNRFDGTQFGFSSGISRGIPASDFVVSLGTFNPTLDQDEISGTFMHELGHNLGLMHGGSDGVNYKPNFLSVMNYFFQFGHVPYQSGNLLDYSRFYLDDLVENNLDEPRGLDVVGKGLINSEASDADLDNYGTRLCKSVGCPAEGSVNDANPGIPINPPINHNVDWNQLNGSGETGVTADLNGDGVSIIGGAGEVLRGNYNDWDWLLYAGGSLGGTTSPFTTVTKSHLALLPVDAVCPLKP